MKIEIDHKKLAEIQDKANRYEQEGAAMNRLVAFEAAMRVLHRHKLIEEFAKEYGEMSAEVSDSSGIRQMNKEKINER